MGLESQIRRYFIPVNTGLLIVHMRRVNFTIKTTYTHTILCKGTKFGTITHNMSLRMGVFPEVSHDPSNQGRSQEFILTEARGLMASAGARAYNGGLRAEPPAGSRGRAPGQGVRGEALLKLNASKLRSAHRKAQIWPCLRDFSVVYTLYKKK